MRSTIVRLNELVEHNVTVVIEYLTVLLEYIDLIPVWVNGFVGHSKHSGGAIGPQCHWL